ncbi:MAG: Ig-like domain-containing protein, partial [Bacteroidota bacterium]|nr:Ig-like domain-containing protein [Bacteroidota bacterium]
GGGVTTNNFITGNKLDNIEQSPYGIGILIYNNFYAAIDNNVMTRVRAGVQTGNFFSANTGTTNSISNNSITSSRRGIFHNLAYGTASAFNIQTNTIATSAGSLNHLGISLSSLSVGANVSGNNISGAYAGVDFWNCSAAANVTVSGGAITGCQYGVVASNYDGYASNANPGAGTLSGVTISGSGIAAVHVKDNPANTINASITLTVTNDCQIIGTGQLLTGIHVDGEVASANIVNNDMSIHGFAIGVDVNGGSATVTNNHIYDNGIGVNFRNDGVGTVSSNEFNGTPDNGVDVRRESTAIVGVVTASPNNNLSGISFGVQNQSVTGINATLNYWGAANGPGPVGPGSGANVSTNVLYCPWLNAPAPGGSPVSPNATITVTETSGIMNNDGIICTGASVLLNATAPAATYAWSTGATTPTITVSPISGMPSYSVTISYPGCVDDASVTITVNPLPVITSSPAAMCVNQTFNLSPSSGGTWISGNPAVASVNNAGLVTALSPGVANFTFTDANGCSTTTSSATINPLPVCTITANPTIYSGSTGNNASIVSAGVGATYLWGLSSGMITAGLGTNSISYTGGSSPSMTISVTVTNSNFCTSTCSFVVNVLTPGVSNLEWIPNIPAMDTCGEASNCCLDSICFGLRYTPGVTGNLTTYTTGFLSNCLDGISPIGTGTNNESCIMNDNSMETNCLSGSVLFN